MARIFVALYNFCRIPEDYCAMPPFFESFIKGLAEAGNEVKCFQTKKVTNRGFEEEIPEAYRNMLKQFDPDLCILFNNSFWDISKVVDCPIIVYDVDSPLEWQLLDNLKEHTDRYLFVHNQTNTLDVLKEDFGAEDKQCCYIPFYSEIRADDTISPSKNIVFLGTNWSWKGYDFLNNFMKSNPSEEDVKKALEVLDLYVKEPLKPSYELYHELENRPHQRLNFGDMRRSAIEVSGYRRMQVLSAVSDLGLNIHGNFWNVDAMNYYPDVLACVRQKKVWTKADSETFYNNAKIALNTKHIHAVNGFSFRVCDILASNACLVSEQSSDLKNLFPNVDIPFFTSPAEAREQCVRLLNNENLRKDIVAAANESIDQNFRFCHVLRALEEFTGLCLHAQQPGQLEIFPNSEKAAAVAPEIMLSGVDLTDVPVEKKKDIAPIKRIYFKTIGKHLGYDPYHFFKAKYFRLWKIPLFKLLTINSRRKEMYMGFIPLVSYNQDGENASIRILLFEKIGNLFRSTGGFLRRKVFRKQKKFSRAKKLRIKKIKQKWENNEPIKICLFVSRINCWMFEDIFHLLRDSGKFEPVIVIKPFLSRGEEHMKECMQLTYDALVEQGYSPIKGYDEETDTYLDVRNEIDPDIVFYTKYWKPHFHENFYINAFRDRLSLLVDYGYNVVSHYSALNFELQNDVDMYFYPSPIHKQITAKHMDNKAQNVVISGSPKLDVLLDKTYVPAEVWKKQSKPKKRIIWAPHHEDSTPRHMYQLDAFYDIYEVMFEIAEKYKDEIQIAFKPHPLLKVKLLDKWGEQATREYYDRWATLENGQLEDGAFNDLFITSDAMILDSLSFIAEYTITGKPALFTVGSNARVLLNDMGTAIYEFMYHAKDDLKTEICEFIEKVVIAGEDTTKEARDAFIKENMLPPNNKTAAENIFDNICALIENEGNIKQ